LISHFKQHLVDDFPTDTIGMWRFIYGRDVDQYEILSQSPFVCEGRIDCSRRRHRADGAKRTNNHSGNARHHFLWFGILKFLPTVTPIDVLAERTLTIITFHKFTAAHCLLVLATWECMIGIGLLSGRLLRLTLVLLFFHLPGTFLPLLLLVHDTWVHFPTFPTFEGQYIIKNIVLIAAGIIVGSSVRGGKIIVNPVIAERAERLETDIEEKAVRGPV
jgi:hypothetical protein